MSTIPTQTWSDLQASMAEDFRAILFADFGCAVAYRTNAPNEYSLPRAYVGPMKSEFRTMLGAAVPGPTQQTNGLIVLVPAAKPGAVLDLNGVDPDLGIARLERGHTFIVPGFAVGEPGTAEVTVQVRGNIQSLNGVAWLAEVTR